MLKEGNATCNDKMFTGSEYDAVSRDNHSQKFIWRRVRGRLGRGLPSGAGGPAPGR